MENILYICLDVYDWGVRQGLTLVPSELCRSATQAFVVPSSPLAILRQVHGVPATTSCRKIIRLLMLPKPLWIDGARLAVPVAPKIRPGDQLLRPRRGHIVMFSLGRAPRGKMQQLRTIDGEVSVLGKQDLQNRPVQPGRPILRPIREVF